MLEGIIAYGIEPFLYGSQIVAMKLFAIAYPIWSPVFLYFHIWFVYGIQMSCNNK